MAEIYSCVKYTDHLQKSLSKNICPIKRYKQYKKKKWRKFFQVAIMPLAPTNHLQKSLSKTTKPIKRKKKQNGGNFST